DARRLSYLLRPPGASPPRGARNRVTTISLHRPAGLRTGRDLELRLGIVARQMGERPVRDLVLRVLHELAPRLRPDDALRAPHLLELAVGEDFADDDRLLEVVVLLVHLNPAARRQEVLARDGLPDRVHVGA